MASRGDIYLDADRSGLAWLLDPASDRLRELVEQNAAGDEGSPADHRTYLADAEVLYELLMDRHPACLLSRVSGAGLDEALSAWATRLDEQKPRTRQECVGSLGYDLGKVLGDAHFRIRFEQRPVARKQWLDTSDVPAWDSWTHERVRIVRIGSVDSSRHAEDLEAGVARAGGDFEHDQMIVDLRGNAGGDDEYVLRWMRRFIPHPVRLHAPSFELRVQDTQLNRWNIVALFDLLGEHLPSSYREFAHRPAPSDVLRHAMVDDGSVPAGSMPWHGTMLVIIDGRSGSSAESAALMLQQAFGARIVGADSFGSIDYGNVCPYLLPNSGLQLQIPTRANDWGSRIDFTGIRPQVHLDVQQPVTQVADQFAALIR